MKLCLIGIDGLRLDLVDGCTMPALAAITAADATRMTMDAPTWSGPGWATILTGASIGEHGVVDNSFAGNRLAAHPDLLTLAWQADPFCGTFAAASWLPLVDPAGPGPVVMARDEQRRSLQHRIVARDGDLYGYRTTDADVAAAGVLALRDFAPDVSFVYLGEVDEMSHLYGATSDETMAAMHRVDAHLARLVAAIATRTDDDWLLAITTDHGHLDEGGHGGVEPVVRASFVARRAFGRDLSPWPDEIPPTALTPMLLQSVGRGPAVGVQ